MGDEQRKSSEFSAKFTNKLVSMQFASKFTLKESLCRPNYTAYFAVNFSGTDSIVNFAENYFEWIGDAPVRRCTTCWGWLSQVHTPIALNHFAKFSLSRCPVVPWSCGPVVLWSCGPPS